MKKNAFINVFKFIFERLLHLRSQFRRPHVCNSPTSNFRMRSWACICLRPIAALASTIIDAFPLKNGAGATAAEKGRVIFMRSYTAGCVTWRLGAVVAGLVTLTEWYSTPSPVVWYWGPFVGILSWCVASRSSQLSFLLSVGLEISAKGQWRLGR